MMFLFRWEGPDCRERTLIGEADDLHSVWQMLKERKLQDGSVLFRTCDMRRYNTSRTWPLEEDLGNA